MSNDTLQSPTDEDVEREAAASLDDDPDGWRAVRGPGALAAQAPLTARAPAFTSSEQAPD